VSAAARDLRLAALSMASGLHFAVLQASHFLLLEAHLSARSQTYLLTMLCWLAGFWVGLGLAPTPARPRAFLGLLAAGAASYYATWALSRWLPFHGALYVAAALSSGVGALLAGHFFRAVAEGWRPLRRPLLHENNGFVAGLLLALLGAVRAGGWLLAWGPAAGAVLVALSHAAARRELAHPAEPPR
jgi:hypothetical protein